MDDILNREHARESGSIAIPKWSGYYSYENHGFRAVSSAHIPAGTQPIVTHSWREGHAELS